jgi:[ribosomal protein S5]-alanine N-acetyltransferase
MSDIDIFLKGTHIYLKVLTEKDAGESNWYSWFNDEEITKYMQKHYFPNTRAAQVDFWRENIKGSTKKLQLAICKVNSSKILGCISLENIDYLNRKAEISTIIGEKEGRNIIVTIEAYKLIINHAFNTLNLNKIYTGTFSKEFAQLMERIFNFKKDGELRQDVYKDGEYHNVHLHSLLRTEFK